MPTIAADGIYYVDLGADPDFALGTFISVYPEEPEWDDQIGNADNNGVGNISFQISLSAKDQDGATVVSSHDFIGPMRSYFRLRYGNVAIMAGVIKTVDGQLGADFMTITGKTWEHFTEIWQYPFDGRDDHVTDYVQPDTYSGDSLSGSGFATPTGLVYEASLRDVIRIWSDIFSTAMNVPNRLIFDISNLAGLSGIKTNYQLTLGDTTYMDSFIQGLAGTGIGFDWWISWNKKLYWASPKRYGNPSVPTITYTVDSSHLPEFLSFTNKGPNATHVLGTGAGLASQTTLARAFGYNASQAIYTRFDAAYDFGDVRSPDQLIGKTQRKLSNDLQPQHEIPLTMDPVQVTSFWSTLRKGRAIFIDVDLIFHRIDSGQQLVKYSAKMNNEGDVLVDFTLEQIYDLAYDAGSPEG